MLKLCININHLNVFRMAPPINSTLSLLELPRDVLLHTFSYVVAGGGLCSLALASKECKKGTEAILRSHWIQLNLSNAAFPKGPVDLPNLMGRINQSHPNLDINLSSLFQKLANEFTRLGAVLTKGKLPLTTVDLHDLQCEVANVQDPALLAIWPKIALKLQTPPQLQTADQIRTWLKDPTNAPVLIGITDLDFSKLNLSVLPPEIASFKQLQVLFLYENQLSSLPDEIWTLTELQALNLGNNQFSSLPNAIGALKQLETLNLDHNQLRSLPDTIGALKQLRYLTLSFNQFSSLPEAIWALTKLTNLYLRDNQLSSLSDAIRALTQLSDFSLQNNKLSSLPGAIGALKQLGSLNLSCNQLSSLPETIGALTQLGSLNLSNNQLSSLPDTIEACKQLDNLNLSNNQLSSLPNAIRAFKQLYQLHVSNNQLCSLPDLSGIFPRLQNLELNGNPLIFIPDTVINSNIYCIVTNETLINYKQELAHKGASPLAKLYQSIIQKKPQSNIQTAFYTLSSEDRMFIWQYATQGKYRCLDDRVFDDMSAFGLGVRKVITTKLERLSQEKKNQVYGNVYQLAGKPNTPDLQWGEHHALDNFPRLADAIAAL